MVVFSLSSSFSSSAKHDSGKGDADSLASVARLLFGVSTVFTFPLAYAAVKVGVRGVLPKLSEQAVVGLPLGLITAIALLLDDVGWGWKRC